MKNLLKLTLVFVCSICLVACSDDNGGTPTPPAPTIGNKIYVLSEGSYTSKINGDLTAYDPTTKDFVNGFFKATNQRALTGTSNDGIVYGSKLYIANTDENIIEVANATNAKCITQITFRGARCIVADGGYIYVTSYTDNTVSKIDTINYRVVATEATDTYPEGMAISNGLLYVANSGYGNGNTLTVINLSTFKKESKINVPTNPVSIVAKGDELFLACSGKYKADWSGYEENPAVYAIAADGTTTKIADATLMAIYDNTIYLVDNNYYSTSGITYSTYDISKQSIATWTPSELPYAPYALGVNPANGDVYITSQNSIDYGTGVLYPDYNRNGYVMRYSKDGTKLDKFTCGVNPGTIIFF